MKRRILTDEDLRDIEIKKADKELRDRKTSKKYYLEVYDNRVFLREVR